jgi:SAM-dependent methyltransferase
MLLPAIRAALKEDASVNAFDAKQAKTALSFGYEWQRFPEMYAEWEKQFLDYMQPHNPEFFKDKKVLDAGCGNGRFAYYAGKYAREVWAIDLGPAVEVARTNTASLPNVHVVQADLHHPPFPPECFDFIYSIGVLHHLPDPESAFQNLLRYLKPGGEIQIYLYWQPERRSIKSFLLNAVNSVRNLTTRLPHWAVHALAYPSAAAAFMFFVWPYQIMKHVPALQSVAANMPMKQYAVLPFRVCVNDQLDRFSAPIENRYTKSEVEAWLSSAGLKRSQVIANFGWLGTGQKPEAPVSVA